MIWSNEPGCVPVFRSWIRSTPLLNTMASAVPKQSSLYSSTCSGVIRKPMASLTYAEGRQVVKSRTTFGCEFVFPDTTHLVEVVSDPVVLAGSQEGVLAFNLPVIVEAQRAPPVRSRGR